MCFCFSCNLPKLIHSFPLAFRSFRMLSNLETIIVYFPSWLLAQSNRDWAWEQCGWQETGSKMSYRAYCSFLNWRNNWVQSALKSFYNSTSREGLKLLAHKYACGKLNKVSRVRKTQRKTLLSTGYFGWTR